MKSGSSASIDSGAQVARQQQPMLRATRHRDHRSCRQASRCVGRPEFFRCSECFLTALSAFRLHRDVLFYSTYAGVLRNNCFALRVVDSCDETICRESTEHDRVYRADSRTSQHGYCQFRNHLHVNANPITFDNAKVLECVSLLFALRFEAQRMCRSCSQLGRCLPRLSAVLPPRPASTCRSTQL